MKTRRRGGNLKWGSLEDVSGGGLPGAALVVFSRHPCPTDLCRGSQSIYSDPRGADVSCHCVQSFLVIPVCLIPVLPTLGMSREPFSDPAACMLLARFLQDPTPTPAFHSLLRVFN